MEILDKTIKDIAKVCHEANRAFCETIGDCTQPQWELTPGWQKESCIDGVKFHLKKTRQVHESHENWMKHKLNDGWKYGPVKDPEKKEHPCMVDFFDLPAEQQFKDAIFLSIVSALSPRAVQAVESTLEK